MYAHGQRNKIQKPKNVYFQSNDYPQDKMMSRKDPKWFPFAH